ncbi:DUF5693 family protein [Cohnella cellulosilytica]|uniref:DUF5693 family protein n=1 Tax=Cohnella cellulosilytica TaxID=986710 RepID=A0ABW2FAT1_9BACL
MPQWLNTWNAKMAKWLWWVVLLGVVAALPVVYAREQTETSADQVAIVMDYRDLLQVSNTQVDPRRFVQEQIELLKDAGVNGMVVFESTLEELGWAGEVNVYNATQAALLEGRVSPPEDNGTYVIFNHPESEATLRPIIEWAFRHHGAEVASWSFGGHGGLRLGMGYDDALLRPMQPNPIAIQSLRDAGFLVFPRLSDRFDPFDQTEVAKWLDSYQQLGIDRVVFDGEAVTGYADDDKKNKGITRFAGELKEHGIGVAIFENLRIPQKGMSKLANLLRYNAIRAHSVSEAEMSAVKKPVLEDRLVLAVKDRNIRFLYLNATTVRDATKGQVTHPLQNIADVLKGEKDEDGNTVSVGVVQQLRDFGFEIGSPKAFQVEHAPVEKVLRGIAMLGAIALVALTIGLFLPSLRLLSLVVGAIGGAGLYVLSPTLMVQALALFAAIAAPTAAVVLLVKRIRTLRDSSGEPAMSPLHRLGGALLLFVRTTILSLAAVPLVVALLNHISYSLVLQQFRGVSILHLLPIALVALYVFLYGSGNTVVGNARKILSMPLTVLWIVGIGIIAAAGLYYLSRTGNSGQVTGIELKFRSLMENAFGVRPRTKEFLLGHPLFFAGIFVALRYRWGMVLLVLGTIAQLSMVDTFAHIHTPLLLSFIRVLLGLGLGLIIGLVAIGVWQVLERLWVRWGKRVLEDAG